MIRVMMRRWRFFSLPQDLHWQLAPIGAAHNVAKTFLVILRTVGIVPAKNLNQPNPVLQQFEVPGEPRRRIRMSEGLVRNQTESAGADESTVPRLRAVAVASGASHGRRR